MSFLIFILSQHENVFSLPGNFSSLDITLNKSLTFVNVEVINVTGISKWLYLTTSFKIHGCCTRKFLYLLYSVNLKKSANK